MRSAKEVFYQSYHSVTGSIAFYPALIAVTGFLFSLLIVFLEYQPILISVKEKIPFLLVEGKEDARLILGTLVGSIISLMVFSFSMVMVVLNRMSSTFSPRVIPGLLTENSNQVVLGYYLGTIIFSLILIINIQSDQADHHVPRFGVLLAMLFGINCLGFFVYFIHSISQSIQIDNVLNKLLTDTLHKMQKMSAEREEPLPDTTKWQVINTAKAGYLKCVEENALVKLLKKNDIQMTLCRQIGTFFIDDYPYIKTNKKIDEDLQSELQACFLFYPEERLDDHYIFGFNQISEIAVKALSPGVNDPGTAAKAVDMLTTLFIRKMKLMDKIAVCDEEGKPRLFYQEIPFDKLLIGTLGPIREYGKRDMRVMVNLLEGLKNMFYVDRAGRYARALAGFSNSVLESCRECIGNSLDIAVINSVVADINQVSGNDYRMEPLQ